MNRTKIIIEKIIEMYPEAHCELIHSNPYELLVATVLSAQSTDKRVNIVVSELFKIASNPHEMLDLGEENLIKYIKSIGFYNAKAKNILELSRIIIRNYEGNVPGNMEDLLKLPGVGRKTANVVLSNAFNIPAFAVDTHVIRISNRLGMTKSQDPRVIEDDITKKIPKYLYTLAHHAIIFHGRKTCKAINPSCECCPFKVQYCKYYNEKGLVNIK
ncbi:MAG: endonuclease III [Filifactoraceae bacterium]